jgi:hypothetical protein
MKNTTTFLTLAAATLLSMNTGSVSAQATSCKPHEFNLGARGAVNASMLYAGSNELNKGYSFDASYTVGLTGSYALNNLLSLVAEVDYAKLSTVRNGVQPLLPGSAMMPATGQLFADFKKKESFSYIETPVMLRITTGKKVKMFANAGPYAGFLTAAKITTSGNSVLYKDVKGQIPEGSTTIYSFAGDKDATSNFTTVNFGVAGGIGASYAYNKHTFSVDARYNLGLTNIRTNEAVYGINNLQTIALGLGYSYQLFK